jgi:hypothetical protein
MVEKNKVYQFRGLGGIPPFPYMPFLGEYFGREPYFYF